MNDHEQQTVPPPSVQVKLMEQAVEQEFGKPDGKQEAKRLRLLRRNRSLMALGEHRGRQLTSAAAMQPWKIGEAAQQVGRDRTLCTF